MDMFTEVCAHDGACWPCQELNMIGDGEWTYAICGLTGNRIEMTAYDRPFRACEMEVYGVYYELE